MDNENISSVTNEFVNIVYQETVQSYTPFASFAIFTYASFLHFPDEVEYIWKAKFTLPTYLYFLSKYSVFLYLFLQVVIYSMPDPVIPIPKNLSSHFSSLTIFTVYTVVSSNSLKPQNLTFWKSSLCNKLNALLAVISIFSVFGIQGLISIRTHAFCQGYRPMTIALSITFLIALILSFYVPIEYKCGPLPANVFITNNIRSFAIIISDALAFIGVVHAIWRLRRLKRSLGLQSNKDLTTFLLQHGILKFCLLLLCMTTIVLLLTILGTVYDAADVIAFQNVFSSLLVCEVALDIRQRNTQKSFPNRRASDLPTPSFHENPVESIQSALRRLHESIVDEMGERNEPINNDDLCSRDPDVLQDGSHGALVDIDHNKAPGELERGIVE